MSKPTIILELPANERARVAGFNEDKCYLRYPEGDWEEHYHLGHNEQLLVAEVVRLRIWRPFATAPKDGAVFQAWGEECGVILAQWRDDLEGPEDWELLMSKPMEWPVPPGVELSDGFGEQPPTLWQPMAAEPDEADRILAAMSQE